MIIRRIGLILLVSTIYGVFFVLKSYLNIGCNFHNNKYLAES